MTLQHVQLADELRTLRLANVRVELDRPTTEASGDPNETDIHAVRLVGELAHLCVTFPLCG